jgi:hypothetical protein
VGKYQVVCAPGRGHRRHVLDQDIELLASFRAPLPLPPVFDHPLEPWSVAVSHFTRHVHRDALPCRHSADTSTIADPPDSG